MSTGLEPGPASFGSLSELSHLYRDHISITNTIGDFSALTLESVVTMFINLGNSVQEIAVILDVPGGIPIL